MTKSKIKLLLNKNSSLFDISLFIIVSAFVSILVMDIIVMPITVFAVEETDLFNSILQKTIMLTILVLFFWTIIARSLQMKKSGYSGYKIFKTLSLKPFKFLGIGFYFIILIGILISILYLFFSLNNSFLYRIMNN
jgi:hypothetical protein